jgi:hypothetical protein
MKLPRTLRLDASDTFIFSPAAEAGEWAVSGSFLFFDADAERLSPKERAALRAGFLGVTSFGWSTLVVVTPVTEEERVGAVESLARFIHDKLGAPTMDDARAAAEEEIAFAASICDHPEGTVLAVQRSVEDGEIRERFRTLHQRAKEKGADGLHAQARAFTFVESEGEEIEEHVDLMGLMKDKRP